MNLVVHVEGQTEERFVDALLAPHLGNRGYSAVRAGFVGGMQGGITSWTVAQRDIVNHLEEDPLCIATTMVDYYGLPATGGSRWPGRAQASELPFTEKAPAIEDALLASVLERMGAAFDGRRFVPYVMMHEFEALLFSDCDAFARAVSLYGRSTRDFNGFETHSTARKRSTTLPPPHHPSGSKRSCPAIRSRSWERSPRRRSGSRRCVRRVPTLGSGSRVWNGCR